jgi:cytochrome c biogenesis protein CcdA
VFRCTLFAVQIAEGSGMHQVLFGTALLVSFLGGVVALLAPCCVSVMLPAYFATGFGRRSGIAAATGVFAAGVATLIVPIGLGASALSAALPALSSAAGTWRPASRTCQCRGCWPAARG